MADWPNFIPVENHLVVAALQRRLGTLDAGAALDDSVPDAFCEATYRLQCRAESASMTLSYALWPSFERADTVMRAAHEVERSCQGVATVLPTPVEGTDLSIEVDLKALAAHPDQEAVTKKLASLYSLTAGLPLRDMFQRAAAGESMADKPKAVQVSARQVLYVQEGYGGADTLAVIFPITRRGGSDDVLSATFLQEFAAFRQSAALGSSPACTFSKQLPPELQGMVEAGQGETSGGYITFVLNQRHLAPDKLDSAAWAMLSFFPLVLYHVKCCKLAMHTSMRRRVDSMMQVLNRAVLDSAEDEVLQ